MGGGEKLARSPSAAFMKFLGTVSCNFGRIPKFGRMFALQESYGHHKNFAECYRNYAENK